MVTNSLLSGVDTSGGAFCGGANSSGAGINSADLTVYQQPGWLEIAKRDEDYREIQVRQNGVVVGSLPFIVRTGKAGLKLALPPLWSRLGGPVVSQSLDGKEKAEVIRQLIAQLPGNTSFKFVCSPDTPDADLRRQEFLKAGFKYSTETTYLQYPDDSGILERLSGKPRKHFASAARKLSVIEIGADEFVAFYAANLRAAGAQSYASLDSARDLIARGRQGGVPQVRVIAAKQNEEGSPFDSAIAYAWDNKRYYLWTITNRLASADRPEPKPHPDAAKLLILHGTEDARKRGLIFDADGATTEGKHTLYGAILKFPHLESRDVFIRETLLEKAYQPLRRLAQGAKDAARRASEALNRRTRGD